MPKIDNWGGAYNLTNEAKRSLEADLEDLIDHGRLRGETASGGTFERLYHSDGSSTINIYEASGSKKGYSHIHIRLDSSGNALCELVHK